MSEQSKSKKYLAEKKQQKKGTSAKKTGGKKKMKSKDKRILITMVSIILVLTIVVGILITVLANGSIFKEKIGGSSGSYYDNGEWTDIDIQTPDDLNDGRKQKENVYTFVCCGIDIDEYRADTIMLVTLDMNQKRADVMHILRDTFVHTNGRDYKINSFYARKKSDGIRQIIYNRMGIYPNYYVTLNFEAFRNVVDIIGGVEIEVPFDMRYSDPTQGLDINLKAGKQMLNGDQAEQFVRYRKGSGGDGSDESRQKRQEQFLKAFMQRCIDTCADSPSKAVDIVTKIIKHMKTNLSIAELTTFAHYGMEIGVDNVNFHTLPGDYKYVNKVWYYQGYPSQTLKMLNEFFNPYEEKLTASRVDFDEPVEKQASSSKDDDESSTKKKSSSSSEESDTDESQPEDESSASSESEPAESSED